MALTAVEELYNLALGFVGEHEVTEGATTEKQYELCSRYYALARDETLALHPWNEAVVQDMVLQETTAYPLFDYSYKYALPSDCLRVLSIGETNDDWEVQGEYIVTDKIVSPPEYDASSVIYVAGQYISHSDVTYLVNSTFTSSVWATDLASYLTTQSGDYGYIPVTYIKQLTDTTKFSVKLKNAIAHKLAIKIATPITNNPKVRTQLIEEFERLTMPQARSVDAMQGTLKTIYDSKWLRSRR